MISLVLFTPKCGFPIYKPDIPVYISIEPVMPTTRPATPTMFQVFHTCSIRTFLVSPTFLGRDKPANHDRSFLDDQVIIVYVISIASSAPRLATPPTFSKKTQPTHFPRRSLIWQTGLKCTRYILCQFHFLLDSNKTQYAMFI